MSRENLSEQNFVDGIIQACTMEDSLYDKYASETQHVFSDEYRTKMQILANQEKQLKGLSLEKPVTFRRKRVSLRVRLALVAVMVMLFSVTALAAEPIREKIIQIVEKLYSDHTDVSFEEKENTENTAESEQTTDSFEPHRLTWLPDGYELNEEVVMDDASWYVAEYKNGSGRVIHWDQMRMEDYEDSITSDGNPAKEVEINGKEAYWISDEKGDNTVIYIDSGCVYTISSMEDIDVIIKIFEKNF